MVKKLLQVILVAAVFTSASFAQSTMKVVLKNGTNYSYPIETLQELVFIGTATWKVQVPPEFDGGSVYLIEKKSDGTVNKYPMTKDGDKYVAQHDASVGDTYTYGINYNDVFYTDEEDYFVNDNFNMTDDASGDNFLEGLRLSTKSIQLEAGGLETLKAFWHGSEITPVWLSGSTAIATVTAAGEVYGAGKGNTTITATYKGESQVCSVQVDSSDPRTTGANYYVFYMDDDTYELIENGVAQDYRINETSVFLDVYENSYKSKSCSGLNAYGKDVDWLHLEVNHALWNAGSAGFRVKGNIDLSGVDGSYNLHIDYKSSDNSRSYICIYNVATNEEKWVLLPTSNDGQWHSFDKSVTELGFDEDWFTSYSYTSGSGQPVIAVKTEGMGMDLEWCGIYLYQHGGLVISQTDFQLKAGESKTIKVYNDGTRVSPTWSSSDPTVATVDANGNVTAHSGGTAVITAVYNGEQITTTVVVKALDPRLIGYNYYVMLMDDETYAEIEQNVKYDYRINDSERFWDSWSNSYVAGTCVGQNAYEKEETWLSLIAQENPWEGKGAGGIRSQADVKFSEINDSYRLHIDYKCSDGARNEFCLYNMADHTEKWFDVYDGVSDGVWHSFDKSIKDLKIPLTWFNDYTYTSGDGEYIIATRTNGTGKQLDWCSIFLYQPAGLILNSTSAQYEVGETDKLIAYLDGVEVTPTWQTSASSVVQIDASGNISAVGAGSAVITATINGQNVQCAIRVIESDYRLKGSDYYLFVLDDVTYAKISDRVAQDYRVNDTKVFLYPWENSYRAGAACEGENAYGQELNWISFAVNQNPWTGVGAAGIFVADNISMSGIADDFNDYYLHVDYKLSSEATKQEILLYNVASASTNPAAEVSIPSSTGTGWFSYDVKLSEIQGVSKNIFKDFTYTGAGKNAAAIRTTGTNAQFDLCGLYIYKHGE